MFDSFNKNPDGSDIPIVGATIRVDAFPQADAVTDASGRFELRDMPAPEFFVHIDGTTAINAPAGTMYPSVGKAFHSVPGQMTQLNMGGVPFNIFLPLMAAGDIQPLSPMEATDVGFGTAGKAELVAMFPDMDPAMWDRVKVTFGRNSAIDEFGIPATQAVIIPVPADRIPAPLPLNVNPKLVISIQALGATNFDIPAPVTFPNLEGLAPGEQALIWSFNHDAGRWDVVGTGTVTADGQMIVSDGGVIRAPGWHFTASGSLPVPKPGKDATDQDEATVLTKLKCAALGLGYLAIAGAGGDYAKIKLLERGSQLGADHLTHFLDNSGTPRDYPNGSPVSNLVKANQAFIEQNVGVDGKHGVQDFVRMELDRIIAAGGTTEMWPCRWTASRAGSCFPTRRT